MYKHHTHVDQSFLFERFLGDSEDEFCFFPKFHVGVICSLTLQMFQNRRLKKYEVRRKLKIDCSNFKEHVTPQIFHFSIFIKRLSLAYV